MFVHDMSKYTKPEIDETKLGINPFLNSLVIPVNKVKTEDRYRHDGEEWYKGDFEYDASPFCRVFTDAARRLVMVGLTPRGKDLLLWLVYELKKGKDWVWINKERYMEEGKVASMNTYRAAINELITKGFMVKTVTADTYWINPHYFFNGNRIKAFPDNVRIK